MYDSELRWVSPQDFIRYQTMILETGFYSPQMEKERAGSLFEPRSSGAEKFWRGLNNERIDMLKQDILRGRKFYAFAVEFDKAGNLTDYHSGSNEIVAMQQLDVEQVPVYFLRRRY